MDVSEVYLLLCRSGMNAEYYGERLARYQLYTTTVDVIIAIGTAGSGLSAASGIWETEYGKIVFGVLASVSTAFAIAKPIMQLSQKVEKFARMHTGHLGIYLILLAVTNKIRRRHGFTDDLVSVFEGAEARFFELSREDEPRPQRSILAKCDSRIRARHPPETFWYPPEKGSVSAPIGDEKVAVLRQ